MTQRWATWRTPVAGLLAGALLAACSSSVRREPAPLLPELPPARAGGYYKDDGPGDNAPANLDGIPDATPRWEPLHRFANRPYTVFGRDYVPATSLRNYRERGIASWYGRKFHNQKTSSGEIYDMYAMTAAHPTLPLPSYARVTSVATGRSVVVRVNDRGPFHPGRVIDLSYAAAYRLGIAQKGSGEVEVESVLPFDRPPLVTAANAVAAPSLPAVAAPSLPAVATPPLPAAATPPLPAVATPPLPAVATPPLPAVATPSVPAIAAVDAIQTVPVASESGGYAVQLGAFANYANAQTFIAHLANQTASLNVEAKVHQAGGLFRVSVGPYSTREEARRLADRLQSALGLTGTIRPQ